MMLTLKKKWDELLGFHFFRFFTPKAPSAIPQNHTFLNFFVYSFVFGQPVCGQSKVFKYLEHLLLNFQPFNVK